MHQPVRDLVRNGSVIVYTSPKSTVRKAVEVMARHNVGSILVLTKNGDLVGIFTERDVLNRVVLAKRDPDETPISEVMSPDVVVVTADTPLHDVLRLMEEKHCRHIPVATPDRLIGVVSLRDILRYENSEKAFQIEQLQEYIFQRPFPSFSV